MHEMQKYNAMLPLRYRANSRAPHRKSKITPHIRPLKDNPWTMEGAFTDVGESGPERSLFRCLSLSFREKPRLSMPLVKLSLRLARFDVVADGGGT